MLTAVNLIHARGAAGSIVAQTHRRSCLQAAHSRHLRHFTKPLLGHSSCGNVAKGVIHFHAHASEFVKHLWVGKSDEAPHFGLCLYHHLGAEHSL